MSLVESTTGEVVVLMDKRQALKITADIKAWAGTLWLKIEEAYRGQAWRALGYESWEAYLDAEFEISRSRGYRLVTHAAAVRELTAAAGLESPMGDIPERRTRGLDVASASAEIAAAVDDLPDDAPASARVDLVKRVVTEHYETDAQRREREATAVVEAIAKDPEADNSTIAGRCGCSVVVVRRIRQTLAEEGPAAGPAPSSTEPTPTDEGVDEDEESNAPTSDPVPAEDPAPAAGSSAGSDDLASYLIAALGAEKKARGGLLTFDPKRLVLTSRDHDLWGDLAADLRSFADRLDAARAAARPLRSVK